MRPLYFVTLVAALHGCAKDHPDKPKGTDCAAVSAALRAMPHGPRSTRIDVIAKHCTADAWSEAARTCMAAATTREALTKCLADHVTPDQSAKLTADMDQFLREPTPAEMQERLTKLEELSNAMCACKDMPCAQRVNADMNAWSTKIARSGTRMPTPGPEDAARAQKIGQRMGECMQAAMTAGTPPTDAQRYVAKNREFKDRICACKDAACGDAAATEMTTWSEDFIAHPTDNSQMNTDDQAAMEKIEKDVHACLTKLRATR